jgi:O-antigen ligase
MANYVAMADAPHAHNGFLEIALGVGSIGLLILIIALVKGIVRAWGLFWHGENRLCAWPLLIIVYTILANLTEDTLDQADLGWILLFAALLFANDARWRYSEPERDSLDSKPTTAPALI